MKFHQVFRYFLYIIILSRRSLNNLLLLIQKQNVHKYSWKFIYFLIIKNFFLMNEINPPCILYSSAVQQCRYPISITEKSAKSLHPNAQWGLGNLEYSGVNWFYIFYIKNYAYYFWLNKEGVSMRITESPCTASPLARKVVAKLLPTTNIT